MASPPPEKGVLIPPPKRAGLRSRAARPAVAAGDAEPQRPPNTVCQRCGAEFGWERADKAGSRAVQWSARLIKGSEKCDCGYGERRTGARRGPHP
ncbi:hypothetical protein F1188_03175 [Roseospira marina]|uniref:Uncharacterized protein n=1 Tax=Roseospira marina TaxID=140057 RepID=A0A5M6IF71_9PROT|nr:hypothetical protein [Roseospira marina]KAA5606930.1 hypothetical protein F1188_03175 [Roseospira marina]MBB4312897.1 hypothetical protein [Roseospira marina]MBB5086330.1 hypothetical protein [Roseospira marina]